MGQKFLIINADDFGAFHGVNLAIMDLAGTGHITSATVMVPAPWFPQAAAFALQNPGFGVGIHLTLNSEWENCRWRPLLGPKVPSLTDFDGYFYRTMEELELHADRNEIHAELRAQIQTALDQGLRPTHLDNHMFSLQGQDFHEIAGELVREFHLPFRFSRRIRPALENSYPREKMDFFQKTAEKMAQSGVPILDYLTTTTYPHREGETYEDLRAEVLEELRRLPQGISEFFLHPTADTPEAQALNPTWRKRAWEYRVLRDPLVQQVLVDEGIVLVNWKKIVEKCEFI